MTTDQKTTMFALATQILEAAKATENDKFAVYTYFFFAHSIKEGKEIYSLEVTPMKKDENGEIVRDDNGIGIGYGTEECPQIRICSSELYCDNCFNTMMEEMKKVAAKLGIIC